MPFIVNTLWDALLDLDDLTASTNSIMTLLSSLLTYPQVRQCRSVPPPTGPSQCSLTTLLLSCVLVPQTGVVQPPVVSAL